jgi:hypothetical protein
MGNKTNSRFLQETRRQSVGRLKKIMLAAASVVTLYLIAFPTPAPATDYSTKFPNAEPLISEGGHWMTAGSPGVNWHETLCGGHGDRHVSRVSTAPGYAFGPIGPERFGDSLALLTGNWKPDQMAEATVRLVDSSGYPEVEIRLRTSPKDATGYEIMWSALGKKETAYLAIAKWDGPGSKPPHYTILKSLKGSEYGAVTGDVVKGMIVGHTITAYTNGRMQFQISDDTFTTGNPGFGFNEGPSGTYGISSFAASDTVSSSRNATSSSRGASVVDAATSDYDIEGSGIPNRHCVTEIQPRGSFDTTLNIRRPLIRASRLIKCALHSCPRRGADGLPAPWIDARTGGRGLPLKSVPMSRSISISVRDPPACAVALALRYL